MSSSERRSDIHSISQDAINELIFVVSSVTRMSFDIGSDINQCPFCNQFALDHGAIEHKPNCTYLRACVLMEKQLT